MSLFWKKVNTSDILKNEVLEEMDVPDENPTLEDPQEVPTEEVTESNEAIVIEEELTTEECLNESPDENPTPDDIEIPHEGIDWQIEWVQDGDLIISEYELDNLLIMHEWENDSYKKNMLFNAIDNYKKGNNALKEAMDLYKTK